MAKPLSLLVEVEFFAPQLDVSAAIVTECRYFPRIHWLSRLPTCIESLEIAWWCMDWDRYVMLLADMQNQHLGDCQFLRKPVGTWRRFDDLFIDPTADFFR